MKKITSGQALPFIILMAVAVAAIFIPSVASFDDGGKYNTADIAWIIVATALVFLMTPGLAFFYGGMVHRVEIAGSERNIPCELALLATGFVHPQHEGLLLQAGIELDEKGNVKADEKLYQTNIPKIFTAGDMRRGQSLVVWAISEGRECARKVDEYLMGYSLLESKDKNIQV